MTVLIAADMEGVTGVVCWEHTDPAHAEYARFRQLMTDDVNAAIRGAFDGGADEVIVSDGHGGGLNILLEKLDGRARLNSGSPSPMSMVQGADGGIDAVMFVGYHARAGTPDAILSHTWTGGVTNVTINGRDMGEIGINAAVCGHFGAPVIMIAGDQSACAEAVDLLGPIETAIVKTARGRKAAECLTPEVTGQRIAAAARRAVERRIAGNAPAPLSPTTPITAEIGFALVEAAEVAAQLPGARRTAAQQVALTAADMPSLYRGFRVAVTLARR